MRAQTCSYVYRHVCIDMCIAIGMCVHMRTHMCIDILVHIQVRISEVQDDGDEIFKICLEYGSALAERMHMPAHTSGTQVLERARRRSLPLGHAVVPRAPAAVDARCADILPQTCLSAVCRHMSTRAQAWAWTFP